MGNSAAPGGRRVRHYGNRGALEEIRQPILMHVAGEFNGGIPRMLFLQRFHIACRLRMISSAHDQLGVGQCGTHDLEGLNHQFKTLIGAPFAECQDAVFWIAAPGKSRVFGSARQNAMGPYVNILVAVLFVKDLAIARHQY